VLATGAYGAHEIMLYASNPGPVEIGDIYCVFDPESSMYHLRKNSTTPFGTLCGSFMNEEFFKLNLVLERQIEPEQVCKECHMWAIVEAMR
jgi:hypothetical protein